MRVDSRSLNITVGSHGQGSVTPARLVLELCYLLGEYPIRRVDGGTLRRRYLPRTDPGRT